MDVRGQGPEGTAPIELEAHERPVTALAFAPGLDMLASGCRDGPGYFWAPAELDRPFADDRGARRAAVLGTLWGFAKTITRSGGA